ncbi:hypothetical protein CVS40_0065 [Lucilia cuprina]|nr:hypothetical protein CVS40_0065 [Lucilia cuprina]
MCSTFYKHVLSRIDWTTTCSPMTDDASVLDGSPTTPVNYYVPSPLEGYWQFEMNSAELKSAVNRLYKLAQCYC